MLCRQIRKIEGTVLNKIVKDFIVVPVVVLIGVYIAGAFVEDFFNFGDATKYLFLGIGGIGFLIYYSRKKIGEL